MDKPGRHYANQNKPGTERQRLPDITQVKSTKVDLVEAESRMVVTRCWTNERRKKTGNVQVKGRNSYL
jgi:hypothetical protein